MQATKTFDESVIIERTIPFENGNIYIVSNLAPTNMRAKKGDYSKVLASIIHEYETAKNRAKV